MNCGQVQERLSGYLDGALGEASLEAVETHLANCAHCRRELGLLRAVVGFASELDEVAPPAQLRAAIKEAVAKEREMSEACEAYLSMLCEYIDGELLDRDAARVEAHTTSCKSCAKELAILRATVASVQMAEEVAPPSTLRARIAAATTQRRRVPAYASIGRGLASLFEMPKFRLAAGAVAVAAGSAAFFLTMPRGMVEKPTATVVPVKPSTAASAPQVTPTVASPERTRRIAEVAMRRAIHRVRTASLPETQPKVAVVPAVSFVKRQVPAQTKPEKAEEPAVASAPEPIVPVEKPAESAVPKFDLAAEKPTQADKPKDEPKSSRMKIAITPNVETPDVAAYFKNIKVDAEMRRRVNDDVKVDVVNKRF